MLLCQRPDSNALVKFAVDYNKTQKIQEHRGLKQLFSDNWISNLAEFSSDCNKTITKLEIL